MRTLPLLLVLAACGDKDGTDDSATTDDSSASDDSGAEIQTTCTEAPGPDSGCVDYDGSPHAIQGVAFLGAGSGAGLVRLYQSGDGAGGAPILFLDYSVDLTAGEHDCTGSTIFGLDTGDGSYYGANVDLAYYDAWCILTLDATGSQQGDPVQGSFVAMMYGLNETLIPVSGRFNTTIAF
ncbi:MAG: hypothetical protein H6739_39955 [Alphaproteobacteria bacterium]|nr:hypothetical protein [Alphaproteobacteria bacterium]